MYHIYSELQWHNRATANATVVGSIPTRGRKYLKIFPHSPLPLNIQCLKYWKRGLTEVS